MSALGGGFNRSTQHLLIFLEEEVCDGAHSHRNRSLAPSVLHCNDLANIETERSWTAFPNLLGEEESWALLEAWCCRRRRLCYSISVVDVTAVHFTANSNTTRDGTTSVRTAQGRMS